ncbi:TPA: HesA/MoeB/ThiF family protein [Vibrio vulnificus]|nr:HesA/MoeB/ThiF family protein [Vibrio vulnificus]ELH3492406.1 HesA/MoeB/ThiF family protein [Vibrio vulnificus]HAS8617868.1 HesA/MoeB/ThiF family protein [Vibrio vulnificus]
MLNDRLFTRYQRQIALTEIGESGQVNLLQAHVLIIGCGGLGNAAALYLAAAGVGHLVLVDDDVVEESNLHRQIAFRQQHLASLKVDALAEQLKQLNAELRVRTIDKRLNEQRLNLEVMLADIVLDCTDNFPTRQLINQACLNQRTPLVSASAIGWKGQFIAFDFGSRHSIQAKQDASSTTTSVNPPCYHCLFPFAENPTQSKCSDAGVIGPVVGLMGNYQAIATIQKLATGRFKTACHQLHLFDGLTLSWQQLAVVKDPSCRVCQVQKQESSNEHHSH